MTAEKYFSHVAIFFKVIIFLCLERLLAYSNNFFGLPPIKITLRALPETLNILKTLSINKNDLSFEKPT